MATPRRSSARTCFGCGRKKNVDPGPSPDDDFHADSLIKLSHGVTAYRIVEPRDLDESYDQLRPVVVCLHGMTNSSYMWADLTELLAEFEQGPRAKVLVFDFYGRGRSPWTGIPITLDTLVTQTKELIEFLDLAEFPVALVGYDMGGAVAVGFAAKFPNLCASVAIIGPLGVKYKPIMNEKLLNRNYIGEYIMYRQQKAVLVSQEFEFHDRKLGSAHRYMIDKQSAMVEWQIKYTPGYLGGLLSTFRYFPLRGMEELFTAIGRHPRKVLVMWGDHDTVCAYRKCITLMEESFPDGTIVDILDCGHNCVIEKFEEVARELLSFIRKAFEKR